MSAAPDSIGRPQAPVPRWDAIPAELRALPQWVLWRYERKAGRWTKVPRSVGGGAASSTDPATWATFEAVRAAFGTYGNGYDGVGLVTSAGDPYVLIDLDHALDPRTGELARWAAAILKAAQREGAYLERSPSGTGYHIIGRGPQGFRGEKRNDAELYCAARYFTVTGDALDPVPAALGELHETVRLVRERINPSAENKHKASATSVAPTSATDAELIARARNAANGAKFSRLFDGSADAYGSRSEADLALAGLIAFWTGPDPGRIERLMRSSGLRRDKWNERRGESTYLADTIGKALEGRTEFHEPGTVPGGSKAEGGAERSAEMADDALERIRVSLLADLAAGPDAIDNAEPPRSIVAGRLPVGGANLAGTGGAGKTTLKLNECVHIVGGGELYGGEVVRPGPCVLVTAEDGPGYGRFLLRRVLEDGLVHGAITPRLAALAKAQIHVIGWSRSTFGPVALADRDGAVHRARAFDVLLEVLAPLSPAYVTLDPSALFSPGERFGNDGEAFLAAMMHEAGLALGACCQFLDHVSQATAQSGAVHQHAARGATAKTDNARLARQLVKYRPGESDETGRPLALDPEDVAAGRILQLHWTKSNYAPLPPFAWLRRRGYWMEYLRATSADESQAARRAETERRAAADVLAVLETLRQAEARGQRMTARDLEDLGATDAEGGRVTRARLRTAIARARSEGRLTLAPLPDGERKGQRRDYLRVAP